MMQSFGAGGTLDHAARVLDVNIADSHGSLVLAFAAAFVGDVLECFGHHTDENFGLERHPDR